LTGGQRAGDGGFRIIRAMMAVKEKKKQKREQHEEKEENFSFGARRFSSTAVNHLPA